MVDKRSMVIAENQWNKKINSTQCIQNTKLYNKDIHNSKIKIVDETILLDTISSMLQQLCNFV